MALAELVDAVQDRSRLGCARNVPPDRRWYESSGSLRRI